MELTKGRGPFPTVMARIEVPSDMKQKREMDVRGLCPLENVFAHTLISGKRLFGYKDSPFSRKKRAVALVVFIAHLSVLRTTTFFIIGAAAPSFQRQLPLI